MSKLFKGEGFASLVLMVLGIVLLIWPGVSAQVLCGAFGVVMLVYSAIYLYRGIKIKEKTPGTYVLLAASTLGAILGIAVMASPGNIMAILPIAGGIILALHGVQRVFQSLTLKEQGDDKWWLGLVFGLITVSLGVIIFANPFSAIELLFRMLGLFLVLDGAGSIWTAVRMKA